MRPAEPRGVAALAAALLVVLCVFVPAGLSAQVGAGPGGQPRAVIVDSVAVQGNVRMSRSSIVGTGGIRPGVPISYRDVQLAIKNLWATGQYKDIQVYASGGQGGEPVVLTYKVDEQDLVRTVDIRGLEDVSAKTVKDTTHLQDGQPYSAEKVSEAERFIRAQLSKKGIPFAKIEERREPIPGAQKEIRLVLDVTEGNRVTVAQVDVKGNEAFSDGDLVGALATKPEGFWWFEGGSYERGTFQEDLTQRLPDFYRAHGYLDFAVVDDTLIVDPDNGKARVDLGGGQRTKKHMADFQIEGNKEFPTEQLRQYFTTEQKGLLGSLGFGGGNGQGSNPVFDGVAFQEATTQVQRLYNNNGYLYAQVRPFIQKLDSAEAGAPHEIRVGWEIDEGNPAYVDQIAIKGNDYTYDRVIRDKILLLPGDIYSEDRLLQSYRNIQGLGFFTTPMDPPDIQPDPQTGDVNITFNVKEKQTGSVNFGTAVGGGTGLSGFLGYDQPNLFGQAKEGHLRWDFGQYINSFTASFSDPLLFGSQVSSSFSIFDSTDRYFSFQTGERRRLGASTQFGVPLPWSRFARLYVGYSLSRTTYKLRQGVSDTSLFGRPPGTQSALTVGITRSTLNHPLFPTQGSRQRISFELNGGPLGGDAKFVKQTMDGTWWLPVGSLGGGKPGSRGAQLALGLTISAGAVYGNATNFPFDRFWMGGVQFGQELRGYDETSITPLGYFPQNSGQIAAIDRLGDSFLRMTAEYAVRLNDNISVSLFYDAGNVWADPRETNPMDLYRGAGLGLQLVTPFGPIGLDYAYGFDKPTPGWQLHFRMGPNF